MKATRSTMLCILVLIIALLVTSSTSNASSVYGYRGVRIPFKYGEVHSVIRVTGHGAGRHAIDFDTDDKKDEDVLAIHGGRVVCTSNDGSYDGCHGGSGNSIIVDHEDGYCSLYYHLATSTVMVTHDQYISQGQLIAKEGSTGNSGGDHLHLAVYKKPVGRDCVNIDPRNTEVPIIFDEVPDRELTANDDSISSKNHVFIGTIPSGKELITNGDFQANPWEQHWLFYGGIERVNTGGALYFKRLVGSTNGSVAQDIFYPIATNANSGTPFEIKLNLGNSSSVEKHVTVALHEIDGTSSANLRCAFTIPPQTGLKGYTAYGFANTTGHDWDRGRFEIWLEDADSIPDVLVDNVSIRYEPRMAEKMPNMATRCYVCGQDMYSNDSPFCDVPPYHIFNEHISCIADHHMVGGYSDRMFHPENKVSRGTTVYLLARWLKGYDSRNDGWKEQNGGLPIPNSNLFFKDLSNDPNELTYAAEFLHNYGKDFSLLDGVVENSQRMLKSGEELNREQALEMIMKGIVAKKNCAILSKDGSVFVAGGGCTIKLSEAPGFDDTSNPWIEAAQVIGITAIRSGKFHYDSKINRGEFAAFLSKAMRYVSGGSVNAACPAFSPNNQQKSLFSYLDITPIDDTPSDTFCFPAAVNGNIPDVTVTDGGTSVCYDYDTHLYRAMADVPPDHWAREHIEAMFTAGITGGCGGNGTLYCPGDPIQRDHSIVFILRARHYAQTGESGLNYVPPEATRQIFNDVPLTHKYVDWINEAYRLGIISGFSDNTFRPGIAATRQDWAIMVLRALEGENYLSTLPHPLGIFEDISAVGISDPLTQQRYAAFEEFYWRGITNGSTGCGSGLRYCPQDIVNRDHAAAFINRAFLNPMPRTDRLGDFCFSSTTGFDIPHSASQQGLRDVGDEDIVCYHSDVDRFMMYFNGSANGVGSIDIDTLSIPIDGEIWFSTSSSETIPGNPDFDVKDEDIVRFRNGVYSLRIDGSNYSGLGSEDIGALHRMSASQYYLATGNSAQYGNLETENGDLVAFNPGANSFAMFFDGSQVGLNVPIDGVSVWADEAHASVLYLTTSQNFCLNTAEGELWCVEDGDIFRFSGQTGTTTSGAFDAALCFDASEHEGLEHEDLDALHVTRELACEPPTQFDFLITPEEPPAPILSLQVAPDAIQVTAMEGNTQPQTVTLSLDELSGNTLGWSITEDLPWAEVGSLSGTTPGLVVVTVNSAGLAAKVYTGTLTVNAPDAANSPQTVQLQLMVAPQYGTIPITLTAEPGYNNVQLNWNPTNDPYINHYRVTRTLSGTVNSTLIVTLSDTVYFDADPALVPDEIYCYQVEAVRDSDEISLISNTACAGIKQLELWVAGNVAAPGELGVVSAGVRNAQGLSIAASDIWLDFDASVLEYISIAPSPITVEYMWEAGLTGGANGLARLRIAALAFPPPVLYNDGALFEITFRVIGSSGDSSPLDLRDFIAGVGGSTIYAPDDVYNTIPLTLGDAAFVVTSTQTYMRGDLNGNGIVQAIDAFIAQQIIHRKIIPTAQQRQAGDVNADGEITTEDVAMILYYAAHGVWPPLPNPHMDRQLHMETPVAVALSDVFGMPDAQVETTLSAKALQGMAGGIFVIAYDPQLVAGIKDVEVLTATEEFDLEFHDDGAGLLSITLVGDAPLSGDRALALITLHLAKGLQEGMSAPLALTKVLLNDIHGRDLAYSALQQDIVWQNARVEIESHPVLKVGANALDFDVLWCAQSPIERAFTINNQGTGQLQWTAVTSVPWLNLDQSNGTAPAIVTATVDPTRLVPGNYHAVITITAAHDATMTNMIPVTLRIEASRIVYLPLVLR